MHWEMAKNRKQGQPEIQIYCPNIEDGHNSKTVIDIVSDDYSFLVDSVVAEINRHNMLIDLLLHPILYVEYDSKKFLKPRKESVMTASPLSPISISR